MKSDKPETREHQDQISDDEQPELSKTQRRRREYYERARERSGYENKWFYKHYKSQTPLVFMTTTGPVKAAVSKFLIFEIELNLPGGEQMTLKKLDTFAICTAKAYKHLLKHFKVHEATKARNLVPQPGAGYDPPIAEGLVEKAIAREKQVAMMLLNGTIIIGVPIAESQFSVLLKVPHLKGGQLLVFKHGLTGLRLFEEIKPSR